MKKLIVNGTLFLLISTVLYLLTFWVLCQAHIGGTPYIYRVSDVFNWKGGNTYLKFQELDTSAHYDIVFIGSSHANRGYDPEIFKRQGYSAFNLGTSAQSPMNTYYIVKNYLNSSNTGLLLIDVYEAAMEMDGLESTADLTQNMTSDAAAAGMAWGLKDPRGLNMLTLRAMRSNSGPMYDDSNYSGSGFTSKSDSVKTKVHYRMGRDFDPFSIQVRYLTKTLDLCADRSIPVVFVNHPYPHKSDHEKHEQFNRFISELIAPYGIEYMDHAYGHDLNDEDHFYDHNHLNTAGVGKYNPLLIEELQQKGFLK